MPHESQVGTPAEWLRRAKSNLIRAQQPRPEGVCWEDLLLRGILARWSR